MRRRRDVSRLEGTLPDPLLDRILADPIIRRDIVKAVDDRRFFDPAGPLRPAYSLGRDARRLEVRSTPRGRDLYPGAAVGFAVPERVAVCVRRHERREVIHALGKAGGGGSRRRRRNYWSDVHC